MVLFDQGLSYFDMAALLYNIKSAYKSYCSADWHWVNNGQEKNAFVIWLVHSGQGQAVFKTRTITLGAGDCFLWRAREPHDATHDPNHPLVVSWALFEYLNPQGRPYLPADRDLPRFHRVIHEMDFLAALLERSIEAFLGGVHEQASHWLDSALREVLRLDLPTQRTGNNPFKPNVIDLISQKIRENPFQRFTVEQLADEFGCSLDHFIRQFRMSKGITPGNFILRCRMQTAADLLRYTDTSITAIAEKLGYPDVYSFSKQFHKHAGAPPSAFRNIQK